MSEGTYVYLLWEGIRGKTPDQLHGIYSKREDAETDAKTMQTELDTVYLIPSHMWVQSLVVDTKPVA